MADGLSEIWGENVADAGFLASPQREKFLGKRRDCCRALEDCSTGNILVCERDPIDFLALLFAALETGHAVTLADPGSRPGRAVDVEAHPACWERTGAGWVHRGADAACPEPGEFLIPTGGSTGTPRLARHDPYTLRAAAAALVEQLGGGPVSSLCVLPLFHVSGLMQVVRAVVSGGVVQFAEWKRWSETGGIPPAQEGVSVSLVFTQLERLVAHPRGLENLGGFSQIFLGGSGWEGFASLDRCYEAGLPVALTYGMTETAAMVTTQPPAAFLNGHRTAGSPLPGIELKIESTRTGREDAGRILLRGPGIFNGYWGEPPRDRDGWWATADSGALTAQGLVVAGRLDRVIKTGGEQVDPAAVEQALQALPGVSASVVMGLPDPEWGMRIVALVEVAPDADQVPESILDALRRHLAPHEIPKALHIVAAIPRRPTGKVDWGKIQKIVGS